VKASKRKTPVPRSRSARDGSPVRSFTLAEAARAVSGRVAGPAGLRLTGLESLERAGPKDLSWIADSGRAEQAAASRAGAFFVSDASAAGGRPSIVVANPTVAVAIWLAHLHPPHRPAPGISRGAHVDPGARLGTGVSVAAGATIESGARVGAGTVVGAGAYVGRNAEIGENCRLFPLAAVLEGCRIGARCVLHSGAIVGSDGFGYVWDGTAHRKIPQLGIVRVEEDVEIGANAAIDRATFGETVIGRGTKIDNLVQVGHNVVVGEHALLCGQAGIGGSSRIGRGAVLAGQAGISDHAEVGDRATVTGQGGVVRGGIVPPGTVVSGMPTAPHREFLRRAAWVARLPELARRLDALEKNARSSEER
jgi:UDP-3-O-[3-hydroxymyristoyl] glucosamine N-acyltransferase